MDAVHGTWKTVIDALPFAKVVTTSELSDQNLLFRAHVNCIPIALVTNGWRMWNGKEMKVASLTTLTSWDVSRYEF